MLPYLEGLAAAGHRIHLLTFEVSHPSTADRDHLRRALADQGIAWHMLSYHKRPSLPATAADTAIGASVAARLVTRNRLDLIHARSHVPAAMALAVRRRTDCGLLFDIRGLLAEEYVDAGAWRAGGLPFRLVKSVERRALTQADGAVVLTERARLHLFGDRWSTDAGGPVAVIPTCADTDAIAAGAAERDRIRHCLGMGREPVIVYLGKFGTWYMEDELARFFSVARGVIPELRLLVISQSDVTPVQRALKVCGVPTNSVVTTQVRPTEVGAHLAAADMAVSFIRDSPSKLASSPTKIAEYLAAGLPIVVSPGVGDTDAMIRSHNVGVVISGHTDADYASAARELWGLARTAGTAERCRMTAKAELSMSEVGRVRYAQLYEALEARRAAAVRALR